MTELDKEKAMDLQRMTFLQKLDKESRAANAFILSPREKEFLYSFVICDRPSLWFTPRRRRWADDMWKREGDAIGLRHPDLGPVFKPKAKR